MVVVSRWGSTSTGLKLWPYLAHAMFRLHPVSACNGASPAPADSPVGSPESGSTIPTEGGSKTVPSSEEDGSPSSSSNGSTMTKLTLSLLFFLIVAISH
ncbi:hypothetical protein ES319_D09G237300v1 [Gossypium barbadense]|uniref:Uncharacterized protein n=2 Tax=Gossypium TaxID=3633 RepID=A0A5J5QCR2_GOSBA|nr:hypothetical protein ES319_D09G237300v1 [Gossypium barbadense]TYG55261.1 hypothetical protein ES288_D09G257700v1 [Gossypium darwinii]